MKLTWYGQFVMYICGKWLKANACTCGTDYFNSYM